METKRLAITEGDVEVFRWLWMLRVLTLEQIRRLRYFQPETGRLSSLDNVRKRLKRLWDAGYLLGDTLRDTNERVYFLGQEALAPLREHAGIEQRRLYRPRGADTMTQLLHPVLVSECAVRVVEALRGAESALVDLPPLGVPFYHTHAVADPATKVHVRRFVTQEDVEVPSQAEPFRIRPDLVFAFRQGDASRLYFLEADRDTESPQEIARKQLGYAAYAEAVDPRSGELLWHRYGAITDFRVLFLTTRQKRVERLRSYLADKPGFDLMAFSSVGDVQGRNIVFDGVWSTIGGEGRALAVTNLQEEV